VEKPILLLTGATGFIGRRLSIGLEHRWRIVNAVRKASQPNDVLVDLMDPTSLLEAFDKVRPAAVVHAAAIANPDACEREPGLARRVNVEAVSTLAILCAEAKARLVHFSTDLVFDGQAGRYSEDDIPRPLSVYGRTKLESEHAVLALCPGSVVLRVSNCYGRPMGGRACFVDELQAALAAGRTMPAFTDQWRTSTAADQLPEVIAHLLRDPSLQAVFHWGGADRVTRYEAALIYCRVMGYDARLIVRTRAADKSFFAPRPRDTSLDSSRLASALSLHPTGLWEGFSGLKRYLA
jgi:dTDP-4-dehydrorhamnose reductase